MKNSLFYFFAFCMAINANGQTPSIVWEKSFGGTDTDKVERIVHTYDGGYALVGYTFSNNIDVPVNKGGTDIFVCKMSSNGTKEWSKTFGGTGQEQGMAIQELPNGDFIICGTLIGYDPSFVPNYGHTDIVVLKLNKNGNLLWKKNMGGSANDYCRDMIKRADGTLMIVGNSSSSDRDLTSNAGGSDFWIVKIDTAANILWQKSYGGTAEDVAYSILETNDNSFVVVGQSRSNIVGVGNYGDTDAFIFKIDSGGNIQWQRHFGGSEEDKFRSVIQLADNSFFVVGDTYSNDYDAVQNHSQGANRDGFAVKLSASGQKEWVKCYGGSSEDDCRTAVQTSDGKIVILNQIHSPSNDGDINVMYGQADFWLIKIDLLGNILWQKNYGSTGHEESTFLINTPDDGFVFVGNAYSQKNYDISNGYGNDDIWVAKLINKEPCRNQLDLTKTVYYNIADFQAKTKINSKVKIENQGSGIQYKAGESVLLNAGFEVKSGNTFKATIEGCSE